MRHFISFYNENCNESFRDYIIKEEENNVKTLIDYLTNDDPKPEPAIVDKLVIAFEKAQISSKPFKEYCNSCGLSIAVVNSMIDSLEDIDNGKDQKAFIEILSKYESFKELKYEDIGLIQDTLDKYLNGELLKDSENKISNDGISKLISNKTTKGSISNGPGENILALVYKNTKKPNKCDLEFDGSTYELKFGNGKISSTQCTGMRNLWPKVCGPIKQTYKVAGIEWVAKKPTESINIWLENLKKIEDRPKLLNLLSRLFVNGIYEMFKKPNGYDSKSLIKEVRNALDPFDDLESSKLLKILGSLSLIAYHYSEGFDGIIIQAGNKSGTYIYKKSLKIKMPEITDFNALMKNSLTFSGPNSDPSYGGGGLTIGISGVVSAPEPDEKS